MALVEEDIVKVVKMEEEITVLYDKVKKNRTQVHEILPDWLLSAVKVNHSFENSKKLSKVPEISNEMKEIFKKSFKKLFPVQHSVIPAIINSNKTSNLLRPHDICVCAPTGSGKTLAYVTPILQLLTEDSREVEGPRALIVLPVRDLALQVFNVFNGFSKSLGIKCCLLTGQKNLSAEQKDLFAEENGIVRNNTDIIVCTPGRLVDHIRNTKELDLTYLRFLVIDEADRVLEEHKHDWFLATSRAIDESRSDSRKFKNILSCFVTDDRPFMQKILLSATLTREPHLLEQFDLHYPQLFVVGGQSSESTTIATHTETDLADNYAAPSTLSDHFVVCPKDYSKIIFIVDQVRRLKQTKILCFTNTRDSANRLHQLLCEFSGVRTAYLSCQLHPKTRRRLVHDFESGALDVLVTVDSMGRGMDIHGVRCVIQYDIAVEVHNHIHRVGRTARGGQPGSAYALCHENQVFHLKKSLASCNRKIKQLKFQVGKCYKYMNEYNTALAKLQNNPPVEKTEDVEMMDETE